MIKIIHKFSNSSLWNNLNLDSKATKFIVNKIYSILAED